MDGRNYSKKFIHSTPKHKKKLWLSIQTIEQRDTIKRAGAVFKYINKLFGKGTLMVAILKLLTILIVSRGL